MPDSVHLSNTTYQHFLFLNNAMIVLLTKDDDTCGKLITFAKKQLEGFRGNQ